LNVGRFLLSRPVREENGSMTLEASLVLPVILLLTFALILLSLTIADRAAHYYSASIAAERAAFFWPHSQADVRTGAYAPGALDGLYWRLKDDAMLAGLMGWSVQNDNGPAVHIGDVSGGNGAGDRGDSLAANKLRKSAAAMPEGMEGTLSYRNQVWLREVAVDAHGAATPDPLRRLWPLLLSSRASASVTAAVVEPAEWMRTFQLVRYYRARMQQQGQGAQAYRSDAAAVLERRR